MTAQQLSLLVLSLFHNITRNRRILFPNRYTLLPPSMHGLTMRSTYTFRLYGMFSKSFNSRPHKEVDRSRSRPRRNCGSFNSRPHKEVDAICADFPSDRVLSTHDLTRRSTRRDGEWVDLWTFQLTTSQGGRLLFHVLRFRSSPFNSRPHKEVDTLPDSLPALRNHHFQLTTSQGGRQHKEAEIVGTGVFQLTTSQGGRR